MNAPADASQHDDVESWRRVLADQQAAFEEVVIKYQNMVAAVAYSVTGNFSLSEEVTQETFWQAWKQRKQLRNLARLASWLCGIARNLAVQASKRESRQPPVNATADPGSSVDDPAINSISAEERQLVWSSLEVIPAMYREALVLFYREGHSIAEVGLALDVSTDVVKQRVHRGREMLRASLARKVEDVLVRSRPGTSLTTRVMIGLGALSVSLKATSTVTAATVGSATAMQVAKTAGGDVAGGLTASAFKSAAAGGASAGIMGGLLGAAGGLGGAFLGCWLPPQMADTMAERRLLEKSGRRSFAAAVAFTVGILALTPLLLRPDGLVWYFGLLGLITLLFLVAVVTLGIRSQRELKQLQADLPADAERNPSPLRRTVGLDRSIYRGRRFTSRWKLLGVPLLDIQFGDVSGSQQVQPGRAFAWIALGDRATGILFAAGGTAKGLIAIGGLAVGGVAVGGAAAGVLALCGVALGGLALGGLALGYEAVGGMAIAWHVATGGGAIAYHLAVGGGAWAHEYAVGGAAWAKQANTDLAQELADAKSKMWLLEWLAQNNLLFIAGVFVTSFAPLALLRFVYRREPRKVETL